MPYTPPFIVPNVPGIYLEFTGQQVGNPDPVRRSLLIGTKDASGTAVDNEPVQVLSQGAGEALAGKGSMLARMIDLYLKNSSIELWVLPVPEDPAGTNAVGSIQFGGIATQSGSVNFQVGGQLVRLVIQKDWTPVEAVAALDGVIAQLPDLPTTSVAAGNQVDLTSRWKGESGNDIDLRLQENSAPPPGITVTFVDMAGGAGDPLIDTALSNLGSQQYNTVALGYNDIDNIEFLNTVLLERWGPLLATEGQGFFASRGDYADLLTLGGMLNSQVLTFCGPGKIPQPSWEMAAATAGLDATRIEIDTMASREDLQVVGIDAPLPSDAFEFNELNVLTFTGVSIFKRDAFGNLRVHKLITTYQLNDQGFPDDSYEELGVVRTLAFVRYQYQLLRAEYSQYKVSGDDIVLPPRTVNAVIFGERIANVYLLLRDQYGYTQQYEDFLADLICELNAGKDGFNVFIPVYLTRPLRVVAGEIAAA